MKARFRLEAPEKIAATMTITMSLDEWEQLREQLWDKWPGSNLSSTITDLLSQSRKVYWPTESEE